MPEYLLTIQLPDNYDPSLENEAKMRDMMALGEENGRGRLSSRAACPT